VPVRAIREAIINSLCHRDFTNPKSNEIAIYRDRIEIFNPGQFPCEYSPEDFIRGTEASLPRNPLIAETLFRSEDVEKWGSGLRRISQECRAAGVRVAFGKTKSGFVVTFYRHNAAAAGQPAQGKVPEKVTEKVPEKVTVNQRMIIESVKQNQYIVISELAVIVGISERKVKENIAKLKAKKILRRIGPDKGGYWEIVKENAE
jgi:ATP-dependent DNA helicase RecG